MVWLRDQTKGMTVSERDAGKDTVPEQTTAAARDTSPNRASLLAPAILRISKSLHPDTVLRHVVESACTLTGAGLGIVATVDEAGAPGESVISGFPSMPSGSCRDGPEGLVPTGHIA